MSEKIRKQLEEMGFGLQFTYIPQPSVTAQEVFDGKVQFKYVVSLKRHGTYFIENQNYSTGLGYSEAWRNCPTRSRGNLWFLPKFTELIQTGKTTYIEGRKCKIPEPKLDSVLWCMCLDAQVGLDDFENFCNEFGYDTDSIKALETHQACQKTARQFQKAGIDFEELLDTVFEDY